MTEGDGGSIAEEPEHPLVARLRPDPGRPAESGLTLVGLLGRSESDHTRRLYFSASLDSYVEFRVEDVLHYTTISPELSPILGQHVTQIVVNQDSQLEFSRAGDETAEDGFDLDVRRETSNERNLRRDPFVGGPEFSRDCQVFYGPIHSGAFYREPRGDILSRRKPRIP